MIIPSAFSGIGRRMIASTIFNNNFPPSNAGIGIARLMFDEMKRQGLSEEEEETLLSCR